MWRHITGCHSIHSPLHCLPNRYTLYFHTSPHVNNNCRLLLCSILSSASTFTSQTTLSWLQSWQLSVKAVYRGCHGNQVVMTTKLSLIHSLRHADSLSPCKVNTVQWCCVALLWSVLQLGHTDRHTDTDRQTRRQTDRHRQTDTQTDRQTHRHRQTDTQTDRQTDTDRHRQTDTQTHVSAVRCVSSSTAWQLRRSWDSSGNILLATMKSIKTQAHWQLLTLRILIGPSTSGQAIHHTFLSFSRKAVVPLKCIRWRERRTACQALRGPAGACGREMKVPFVEARQCTILCVSR